MGVSLEPWYGVVLIRILSQPIGWFAGTMKNILRVGKGRRKKDVSGLLEAREGELRVIFCDGICP